MSWDAIDKEEAELDPSSGLLTLDPSSGLPTSDPRLEDEESGATLALLSLAVRSPVCVCGVWSVCVCGVCVCGGGSVCVCVWSVCGVCGGHTHNVTANIHHYTIVTVLVEGTTLRQQ